MFSYLVGFESLQADSAAEKAAVTDRYRVLSANGASLAESLERILKKKLGHRVRLEVESIGATGTLSVRASRDIQSEVREVPGVEWVVPDESTEADSRAVI